MKAELRPIRLDESSAEQAHRRAVAVHCPTSDEMEMALRVDLAAMRDAAMVGVHRAGDSAAILLGEVVRMAASATFAQVPTSRLIRIKSALTLTMMAAREIERVERDG